MPRGLPRGSLLRDLAYARIKREREKSITILNGSFVREGSLLIPKKENRRILLRESLVMKDPGDYGCYEVAIDQYYLPENFNVDAYLEQIGKDNYLILNNTSKVPANRLGDNERAVWLYQDQARAYGQFLEEMTETRLIYGSYKKVTPELIIDMTFASDELIDKQPRPYAHQLSLSGLSFGGHNSLSYISGDSMGAGAGYRIRGVHREPAEGGAKKK